MSTNPSLVPRSPDRLPCPPGADDNAHPVGSSATPPHRADRNLAGLLHDKHCLTLVIPELSDGKVGHQWRSAGEELFDPVDQRVTFTARELTRINSVHVQDGNVRPSEQPTRLRGGQQSAPHTPSIALPVGPVLVADRRRPATPTFFYRRGLGSELRA